MTVQLTASKGPTAPLDFLRSRLSVVVLWLCTALALAGCSNKTPPLASTPGTSIRVLAEMPRPTSSDVMRSGRAAFIGPFTELTIEVFGVQELQRDVMTDGAGRVSFPLVGTVDAIGKTPEELASIVQAGLAQRYVKNPKVTVNFKPSSNPLAFQSQAVSVDGQVMRPGLYPVVGQLTLQRAIAQAGGLTEFAKFDDVVVFRAVENENYAALYNIEAIRRGNYPDPEVFPGDIVIVGDSPARRRFAAILQASPLITTPLVVLSSVLQR